MCSTDRGRGVLSLFFCSSPPCPLTHAPTLDAPGAAMVGGTLLASVHGICNPERPKSKCTEPDLRKQLQAWELTRLASTDGSEAASPARSVLAEDQWQPLAPSHLLTSPQSGWNGDTSRFLPLLRKIRNRQPTTFLALGSSITGVLGGCTDPVPLLQAPSCRCPRCCGSACGQWDSNPGWARLTFDWFNSSGVAPHTGNRLYNFGEPGGSLIPSLASCPSTYLRGMAPDVVFFDLYTSSERGLERLMRHLLARRPPPLLLNLEFFPLLVHRVTAQPSPSWFACGSRLNESPNEIRHPNASSFLRHLMEGPAGLSSVEAALDAIEQVPPALQRLLSMRPSALGGALILNRQRAMRTLWRHYGQPVARVLGAYGAAFERREHGLHVVRGDATPTTGKEADVAPHLLLTRPGHVGQCNYTQRSDGLHPTSPSSHRLVSDLLVAKLRHGLARAAAAADAAAAPGGGRAEEATAQSEAALPLPMRNESKTVGLACFNFDRLGYDVARRVESSGEARRVAAAAAALEQQAAKLAAAGSSRGAVRAALAPLRRAEVEAKKAETDALRVYGERGGQTSVVATGAPVTPAPSPARILTPAYLRVRRRPP